MIRTQRNLLAPLKSTYRLGLRYASSQALPSDMDGFWMPFSNNRAFKKQPRIVKESSGMYFTSEDGRQILDGSAGLWCTNAGHCHPRIVEAIQQQAAKLDFAPTFQFGHPAAFDFANDLLGLVPDRGYGQVFFTNCGSSAVDTALKISMAYHRANGEASRVRLIGRERGYHGVGFGGISVGGIVANRKAFLGLPHVDHLPHTHSIKDMAFSRGEPDWGAHLADTLESIVALVSRAGLIFIYVELPCIVLNLCYYIFCRQIVFESVAARCLEYRLRDRRTCSWLYWCGGSSQGLLAETKGNLHQIWHSAYFRRSDYWLWPSGVCVWNDKV